MDKKYIVACGCISYKPENSTEAILITIGKVIPDIIVENYQKNGDLEKLIKSGVIAEQNSDISETMKGYDKDANSIDNNKIIEDVVKQQGEIAKKKKEEKSNEK